MATLPKPEPSKVKKGFIGCVSLFVIFFIIMTLSPFTMVPAGHRGVVVRLGDVKDTILPEGFHLINPIDDVVHMSVQTQRYEATSSAASKDLQSVSTTIVVNGYLDPTMVNKLYQEIGTDYENKVVDPAIQESVKAATAQFTAEELITKREEVGSIIFQSLSDRLTDDYIVVESVSIVDFEFSAAFNEAVEAKVTAEQNALAAENKLKQVEFEAQQRIAEAQGEAEAIRIQAEAITSQGGAEYVNLQWIAKWNGVLPSTMLNDSASVLLNLGQ